ncbi:MAG TPA: alpha/beta hydrolase [Cryomorphaceae bacterium]|nr:alpha/beta hydrolase [Cryomorphaceae bacterium]
MKKLKKGLTRGLLSLGFLILLIVILFGHSDIPLEELKSKYTLESSGFLPIDGMDVHYADEGNVEDSIPVVLIHGTGSSLHTFEGWTERLKRERRVIRPDLPGYGLTGPFPDRDYSMESYVDFLKVFLDKLEVDQCVLAGNSLGGGIAWRFAAEHPESVHKLILIDASGYADKAQSEPIAFEIAKIPVIKNAFKFITPRFVAKSSVENVYADKSLVTEDLVDRYFDLTLREGNRQAFVDRLAVEKDTTATRRIPSIEIPTLVLWGSEDQLIPVESARRFHADLPNDTLVILPDLGHVPMEENPEKSFAALRAFLKD